MSKGIDVDLILGIYDAFRRGDTAAILNQLDPKATLEFEGTSRRTALSGASPAR